MQTKLTLRMDDAVIQQAKAYAAAQGRSLSELVEAYFARLAQGQRTPGQRPNPHSDIAKWRGVLKGYDIDQ